MHACNPKTGEQKRGTPGAQSDSPWETATFRFSKRQPSKEDSDGAGHPTSSSGLCASARTCKTMHTRVHMNTHKDTQQRPQRMVCEHGPKGAGGRQSK